MTAEEGLLVENAASSALGARIVRTLFERHSIPERSQTKTVQDVLGISYQSAYRRMTVGSWAVEELEALAAQFGESLADVLYELDLTNAVSGVFVAGGFQCNCRALLGDHFDPARPSTLAARKDSEGWIISQPIGGAAAFVVKRLVLDLAETRRRFRIAVVDDDQDIALGACAYLAEVGFTAQPFFTFEALLSALNVSRFDAFVLDWWVGGRTALDTIGAVRGMDSTCPICVLTGQIQTGRVEASDLATVIATYNIAVPFEKPLRAPLLAAWLHQTLPARP